MAISRWTPFQDMYALQNSLNSFLREANRGEDESFSSSAFVPPVDIYEDANHVVLKLEVPGMKLDDFNIQLENNALTVRGERRFEKETKEENFTASSVATAASPACSRCPTLWIRRA